MKTRIPQRPICSSCNASRKERRYIKITTEIGEYIYCDKCARNGYLALAALPELRKDEKDLMQQLGKFIGD